MLSAPAVAPLLRALVFKRSPSDIDVLGSVEVEALNDSTIELTSNDRHAAILFAHHVRQVVRGLTMQHLEWAASLTESTTGHSIVLQWRAAGTPTPDSLDMRDVPLPRAGVRSCGLPTVARNRVEQLRGLLTFSGVQHQDGLVRDASLRLASARTRRERVAAARDLGIRLIARDRAESSRAANEAAS